MECTSAGGSDNDDDYLDDDDEGNTRSWVLAEMRSAVCEIFKRRDIAKPTRDPLIRK